jgi:signal transduction histidine kinase
MVKALNFILEVRSKRAAFDWQINVEVKGEIKTLHFAGAASGNDILVVAAENSNGVMTLYEEMMRINNEQINELRTSLKERAQLAREQADKDRRFYDELTRLNNELANLQRELVKKNMELERLNELKNSFLGMAAHDLRNPLGTILMYGEFLEEEAAGVLDETQMEFVSIIKSTSEFMLEMVNDLLDLAKIESGKLELETQYVDLADLALKNVRLNQPIAQRKNIELKFLCREEKIEMMVDPGKISQVFQNLISNAIKFSHPGTAAEIHLESNADGASITVRDQGQGIPEDQLEGLFTPFKKVGVKTTGGEDSTGLGLAIVRKIVEGHGGKIGVKSKVGLGSEFHFFLPS